jgi:Sensors of blue-light using FAD
MIDLKPEQPTSSKSLHEVVYVSTLAAGTPVNVVGEIARNARIYNAAQNITGVMIFDGNRFCQQLEGEQKKVMKLVERISEDPRHANMQVFYHGPLAERRFKSFSLAFAEVETSDLAVFETLDGERALKELLTILPKLDLGA